jgi:hypothetical protein
VRIAVPFGTSVLWDLAIRFLDVGQKCGFTFNGASGRLWDVLHDHDLKELVGLAILLSYCGITPACRYMRDLLIARIGGQLVVDDLGLVDPAKEKEKYPRRPFGQGIPRK